MVSVAAIGVVPHHPLHDIGMGARAATALATLGVVGPRASVQVAANVMAYDPGRVVDAYALNMPGYRGAVERFKNSIGYPVLAEGCYAVGFQGGVFPDHVSPTSDKKRNAEAVVSSVGRTLLHIGNNVGLLSELVMLDDFIPPDLQQYHAPILRLPHYLYPSLPKPSVPLGVAALSPAGLSLLLRTVEIPMHQNEEALWDELAEILRQVERENPIAQRQEASEERRAPTGVLAAFVHRAIAIWNGGVEDSPPSSYFDRTFVTSAMTFVDKANQAEAAGQWEEVKLYRILEGFAWGSQARQYGNPGLWRSAISAFLNVNDPLDADLANSAMEQHERMVLLAHALAVPF